MVKHNIFSVFTSVAGLGTAFCLGLDQGLTKDIAAMASSTLGTWGGNALFELIKSRAVKKEEMLNHHLQRALKEAQDWALNELKAEYLRTYQISQEEEEELSEYIAGLKKLGVQEWLHSVSSDLSREDVFSYVEGRKGRVRELVRRRMNHALGPNVDEYDLPPYFAFLLEHLPAKMAYAFREKIKHGGEAKNALDLLYFESLQEGVRSLLQGQNELVKGQQAQQRLLEELRALPQANGQWQQSPNPYTQAWGSALSRLGSELDQRLATLQQSMDAQRDQLGRTHEALREVGSKVTQENRNTRRSLNALLWAVGALTVLVVLGMYVVQPQPFALTVAVLEAKPYPQLPPAQGQITIHYLDKTETQPLQGSEAIFKALPPDLQESEIRIRFAAPGFVPIDTMLVPQANIAQLHIRRNGSLAKVFGMVSHEGQPLGGVQISVQDLRTWTRPDGTFALHIPPEKQREKQKIRAMKPGFKIWEYESPVVPEEVRIALEN